MNMAEINGAVMTYGVCVVFGHNWTPWLVRKNDDGVWVSAYTLCSECGEQQQWHF